MSGHTVSEVIPLYLNDQKARGLMGREHARCARSILLQFSDHCGKRRIRNVGPSLVESWLAGMPNIAVSTLRQRLSAVRSMFRWAIRKGFAKRNPAEEVDAPKQPRSVPRALPPEAITAVLEHCPDARARLIVLCMAQQGLRCCEVSRLTMGDLDLTYGTMRVRGKGNHERILPIMDETRAAIYDYLGEHPASAGAFVRSYNQVHRSLTPAAISTLVAGWLRDAGIKKRARDGVSAHSHRHSCATDMLRGGAHLVDVQQALGHRFLTTTQVYLPLVVNGLDQAMSGRNYRSVPLHDGKS